MIGLDVGTYHTLAVRIDATGTMVPVHSIPSIALVQNGSQFFVGGAAEQQCQLGILPDAVLILAPKLLIGEREPHADRVPEILERLCRQALLACGQLDNTSIVATVPPAWNMGQCEAIRHALAGAAVEVTLLHEPIALLVATWHLAESHHDTLLAARLRQCSTIVVCDWGAGTVDLAVVTVEHLRAATEFQCLVDDTDRVCGGTSIARGAVRMAQAAGAAAARSVDHLALLLQQSWDGLAAPEDITFLNCYVSAARRQAADTIVGRVRQLNMSEVDWDRALFLLHGGPLESDELRGMVQRGLEALGIPAHRHLHVGNDFTAGFAERVPRVRRDALVAYGAAVYGERGEALPEFAYEVHLRDAGGAECGSVTLRRNRDLEGTQVVTPPFTGVDYFARVQQRRLVGTRLVDTSLASEEVALHVREHAVIRYRIKSAQVSHVQIEAIEAENSISAPVLPDARSAVVDMPERSTRFSLKRNP